jgi:hypothetical protein
MGGRTVLVGYRTNMMDLMDLKSIMSGKKGNRNVK